MALSENIKARRTQLKMSQEYVADQLGISRQAVAKWEAGTSEPTSKNLSELAFLFEISISELVDPQTYAEEQAAQEQKFRDKQQNAKMLFGRWGGVILLNAGWDGYSSGLYGTDFPYPYHWLAILTVGLVLLFITSKDMGKKHRLEALQSIIGLAMIFLYFLFAPHHSFGAGWSEVSSGRRSYCDLRHFIKFKILALYLEGQIKQKRL